MNSTVKHTFTNPTLTDMTKSKTLRNGEEIIKPTGEWVTRELSFRLLIQLQEYNKSLEKLLGFLCKDENKHIFINLSKEDGNFYKTDLWDIMLRINTICDSGLEGKDRDWVIASHGTFVKPVTKVKMVRTNGKAPMSGMKKPKVIEE
jgi:hypothetical protein